MQRTAWASMLAPHLGQLESGVDSGWAGESTASSTRFSNATAYSLSGIATGGAGGAGRGRRAACCGADDGTRGGTGGGDAAACAARASAAGAADRFIPRGSGTARSSPQLRHFAFLPAADMGTASFLPHEHCRVM